MEIRMLTEHLCNRLGPAAEGYFFELQTFTPGKEFNGDGIMTVDPRRPVG